MRQTIHNTAGPHSSLVHQVPPEAGTAFSPVPFCQECWMVLVTNSSLSATSLPWPQFPELPLSSLQSQIRNTSSCKARRRHRVQRLTLPSKYNPHTFIETILIKSESHGGAPAVSDPSTAALSPSQPLPQALHVQRAWKKEKKKEGKRPGDKTSFCKARGVRSREKHSGLAAK